MASVATFYIPSNFVLACHSKSTVYLLMPRNTHIFWGEVVQCIIRMGVNDMCDL